MATITGAARADDEPSGQTPGVLGRRPALGERMDNEGFSRAYAAFFGTPAQPHLVARTRVQVVGLVNPGWLVAVDAIAVR